MRGTTLLTFVVALAALVHAPALAQIVGAQPNGEQRLALVIGNAAYADQALKNPVNDARAMSASLKRLGFAVIERFDADKKAMDDAVLEFGEKLRAGGVGLFYYAGHGVQTRGHNYLVPTDAAITSEASVRVQALDMGLVLDLMADARNRANVVILDACRNNPFRGVMRGSSSGLAAIDAARGTLIAYSTAPGAVATDGEDTNSPYTAALVKALSEPGVKVEEMFKRVRGRVVETTRGAQTPWESSSLTGDLVLNLTVTVNPPAQSTAPATGGNRDAVEVAFWQSIAGSKDLRDYQDYLAQFPDGAFVALAKRRAESLAAPQQAALPSAAGPANAVDPLQQTLVAKENVRVRDAPGTSGKQIASLSAGETVKALGKVTDANWFLVERGDGTTGYVAAWLMEDAAAYRAREEAEQRKAAEAEHQRRQQQALAPPPAPPAAMPTPPATAQPSPYAAAPVQSALAPVAPAQPAPRAGFDGRWVGEQGHWRIEMEVRNGQVKGKANCSVQGGAWSFSGAIADTGSVGIEIKGIQLDARQLSGVMPELTLTPGGNCGGAKLQMRQLEAYGATATAAVTAPATQAPNAPAAVDPNLRQRAYDHIMRILLDQTVGSGPDAGKRNPYRRLPKPKALAVCVDWSAAQVDQLLPGAWADSYVPPGRVGVPVGPDAIRKCDRVNDTPARCRCQVIDENDEVAIEVPEAFVRRVAGR